MKTLNAEKIARPAPKNRREHSVPWFWPLAAGIELGEAGLRLYHDNLRYLAEAEEITFPPPPEWATVNRILLDLDTMRVRDFSPSEARSTNIPVLIDAPYARHSSTIADYAKGHSPGSVADVTDPVVNDSKKFSNGRLDCTFTRFHCRSARNIRRKLNPLAPKMSDWPDF